MPRASLCAVLCAAAAAGAAAVDLPSNMHAAVTESRFDKEPSYYVTPVMVEKAELFKVPDARFAELAQQADETPTPAPAAGAAAPAAQGAPSSTKHAGQAPYANDVVQGAGGFQMLPGQLFQPGYYHPPTLPYRFPSYPYDNPSYTPFPSNFNVRLPKPWRSDALNIYSDGARYMQNMAHFDSYPTGAGGFYGGGMGQQVVDQQMGGQDVIQQNP